MNNEIFLTFNWISGIMIGAEFATKEQAVIIDLLIFRIVFEWH